MVTTRSRLRNLDQEMGDQQQTAVPCPSASESVAMHRTTRRNARLTRRKAQWNRTKNTKEPKDIELTTVTSRKSDSDGDMRGKVTRQADLKPSHSASPRPQRKHKSGSKYKMPPTPTRTPSGSQSMYSSGREVNNWRNKVHANVKHENRETRSHRYQNTSHPSETQAQPSSSSISSEDSRQSESIHTNIGNHDPELSVEETSAPAGTNFPYPRRRTYYTRAAHAPREADAQIPTEPATIWSISRWPLIVCLFVAVIAFSASIYVAELGQNPLLAQSTFSSSVGPEAVIPPSATNADILEWGFWTVEYDVKLEKLVLVRPKRVGKE